MVYARQKLYDINHIGFISDALSGRVNDEHPGDFLPAFAKFIGEPEERLLQLGRGRLSLYLATKRCVSGDRNEAVMSPFTIFDMVNMAISGGGRPVFSDSEKRTPHLSLKTIKELVTDKAALVVTTH